MLYRALTGPPQPSPKLDNITMQFAGAVLQGTHPQALGMPMVHHDGMQHEAVARRARDLAESMRQVHETFQHRGRSPEAHALWVAAAARSRAAAFTLYPPDLDLTRITKGDKQAIESAIVFLEVDPWVFRSGYHKKRLLDRLARTKLEETDKQRLRTVIVRTTARGPRMEFHHTLRLAHHLRSAAFAAELHRARAEAPPDRRKEFDLILGAVEGTRRSARRSRSKQRS